MENNIQQEPVYLNYGSDQIDQSKFLTNAANNVTNWINQQSWSKKRKEKFLSAYSDIMSKGIIGASNTSGQWQLDLNQNIDLESMSKKDQEMYHEAAYYILQQMKGITPKAKEVEEQKKDLPLYDNKYFTQQFQGYIGNNLYGGQNFTSEQWNERDPRDPKTGIRGTTNRAEALAQMLEQYGNTLEEGKYNFENTPFKDLNDLKTRIAEAAKALRDGTWDNNDVDALNKLGINPSQYFSTGADEEIQLQDGTTMTRQEYIDALAQQQLAEQQAKEKAELEKKQAEAKANLGVSNILTGIYGHEAKTNPEQYSEWLAGQVGTGEQGYEGVNNLVQSLLEKGYTPQGLNNAEKKQLGNLLYHIRNNNPAYQGLGYGQKTGITQDEFNELSAHKNVVSKNINDYIKLPWQTSDGRNIYADNKGNIYYLKPANHKKLQSLQLDRSKINDYKKNYLLSATEEGRRALAGQRGLFQGGLKEKAVDTTRMVALGEDIASAIAAFVPEYGTAISAGLSLDSLKNDFIADALDDSVSTGQMFGNAAINLGLGVVGLIPGVKIAARMGKWGKAIGKLAPQVLSGGLIAQQALSQHPQVLESWKKAAAGKDLTINDWKNIGQSLRWISGGVKVGKATHNTVKYGKTNPGKVSGKEIQTTKNGKASTAKITNKEFETLNSKKTLEEANKYLQSTKGGKGHTIAEADFKTGRFRNLPSGFGKVRRRVQGKNYTDQAELIPQQRQLQQKYTEIDNAARQRVLEGRGIYRILPQRFRPILANAPTNYQIYGTPYVGTTKSTPAKVTKQEENVAKPVREHISPKDFGLPKNTNLDRYYKNSVGEGNANIQRASTRFIVPDKEYKGTVQFTPNGEELNITVSNGKLVITDKTNKVIQQKQLSTDNFAQDAKLTVGKTISEHRKQLISDKKIRKQFTKEFIQSIKNLKKQGLLFKQGGSINLDKTISEFLSKQK